MNRRGFLGLNAAASTAFFFADDVKSAMLEATEAEQHRKAALRVRVEAATAEAKRAIAEQVTTGDEERYSDKRASFSKTLPHNHLGEVLPEAYRSFVDIVTSGDRDRFSKLPRAPEAEVRLNNPQAAYGYELGGLDTHSTAVAWPPPFASPNMAAEMGELYWQALTRDVPYREYESHPLIAAAVSDLKAFSVPIGPITEGSLTPETLFRGESVGDLIGPYLSQFLSRPVPLGSTELDQRGTTVQLRAARGGSSTGGMVQRGSGGPELNLGDLWEAQGTSRRVTATAKVKCAVVQTEEVRTADVPARHQPKGKASARAPLRTEPAGTRTVKSAALVAPASPRICHTRTLQPDNVGT